MGADSFADIVDEELTQRVFELCELFQEEDAPEPYIFFAGILTMLQDSDNEEMVLAAVIELSRCAFLGFNFSPAASLKIDQLLERAIDLAHTMSASNLN